jgi:hypothetical protein
MTGNFATRLGASLAVGGSILVSPGLTGVAGATHTASHLDRGLSVIGCLRSAGLTHAGRWPREARPTWRGIDTDHFGVWVEEYPTVAAARQAYRAAAGLATRNRVSRYLVTAPPEGGWSLTHTEAEHARSVVTAVAVCLRR